MLRFVFVLHECKTKAKTAPKCVFSKKSTTLIHRSFCAVGHADNNTCELTVKSGWSFVAKIALILGDSCRFHCALGVLRRPIAPKHGVRGGRSSSHTTENAEN